ncbi:casein kinase II subunit beta [Blastocystis sp. subtype 4]|uniref:casein kinase II subunit beta n=1 Tax=Blastocystis sp. subtype 4 TaxID=944170 RepID=UPI000711D42D|nr:casein kinase II subunit beta [Blastocystis sp. subtype 4]KNB44635.1 casein kinase II subunit beta [Blastocystis sp. subtype 4]|eukprot:XP_014528081.1 casein kinase II subunit beta [Blastocystis sp. subtype 4]
MSWIDWFCSLPGNEGICNVPVDFIMDQFNLSGLRQIVDDYEEALSILVGDIRDKKKIEALETSVVELYSLIHQRYIGSEDGLEDMKKKYDERVYGFCPRYYCNNCPLLPVGLSNESRHHSYKLYCPCCKDLYVPVDENSESIDGCFFGTSLPLEFLIHYPSYVPIKPLKVYEPKLYGFALSKESPAYRKV